MLASPCCDISQGIYPNPIGLTPSWGLGLARFCSPSRTNCRNMVTKVMMKLFRRFRAVAAAILLVLATPPVFPAASASEIVIFAAASLKEAMDEATRVYDAQTGDTVKVSYAASSALAK